MISTWRMVETHAPDGTPTLSVPAEYVERWDDEFDGSSLLRSMIRRRDELLGDDDTSALIKLLRAEEQAEKLRRIALEPLIDSCFERLAEIGHPQADEWDDYDAELLIRERNYWED